MSLHRLDAKLAGNRRDPVLLYKPGDLYALGIDLEPSRHELGLRERAGGQ
ncbi:MAG TPA: hypothetical protein VIQ50_00455 [Xanthobacteraceae bacterium]